MQGHKQLLLYTESQLKHNIMLSEKSKQTLYNQTVKIPKLKHKKKQKKPSTQPNNNQDKFVNHGFASHNLPQIEYNSLIDPYLKDFFTSKPQKKHLRKMKLISKDGFILQDRQQNHNFKCLGDKLNKGPLLDPYKYIYLKKQDEQLSQQQKKLPTIQKVGETANKNECIMITRESEKYMNDYLKDQDQDFDTQNQNDDQSDDQQQQNVVGTNNSRTEQQLQQDQKIDLGLVIVDISSVENKSGPNADTLMNLQLLFNDSQKTSCISLPTFQGLQHRYDLSYCFLVSNVNPSQLSLELKLLEQQYESTAVKYTKKIDNLVIKQQLNTEQQDIENQTKQYLIKWDYKIIEDNQQQLLKYQQSLLKSNAEYKYSRQQLQIDQSQQNQLQSIIDTYHVGEIYFDIKKVFGLKALDSQSAYIQINLSKNSQKIQSVATHQIAVDSQDPSQLEFNSFLALKFKIPRSELQSYSVECVVNLMANQQLVFELSLDEILNNSEQWVNQIYQSQKGDGNLYLLAQYVSINQEMDHDLPRMLI